MTLLAGTCTFAEASERARVFLLCQMSNQPKLIPVSVIGEQDALRGVRLFHERRRLEIKMERLPGKAQRLFLGLCLPEHGDFKDGVNRIFRVTMSSGAIHNIPLRVLPSMPAGNRYAIMAIATKKDLNWDIGRMVPPEIYRNREAMSETYELPSWWWRSRT